MINRRARFGKSAEPFKVSRLASTSRRCRDKSFSAPDPEAQKRFAASDISKNAQGKNARHQFPEFESWFDTSLEPGCCLFRTKFGLDIW